MGAKAKKVSKKLGPGRLLIRQAVVLSFLTETPFGKESLMTQKSMTKPEIISQIAKTAGISQKAALLAFESIVDSCRNEVKNGRPFKVAGLGTFKLRERSARKGINPTNGEPIEIAASKTMGFKASSVVASLLNPKAVSE